MSMIEVRDLRMRYGDMDVLAGVTFSIAAGEVVTLPMTERSEGIIRLSPPGQGGSPRSGDPA
jgi:ABC-type uncharacterized transport system YnjBCD ATPase subunit